MVKLPTEAITFENYEQVYDYYDEFRPNPILSKIGHIGLAGFFWPRVEFAPGVQEFIAEQTTLGNLMVLIANHSRYVDHMVLDAAYQKTPTLRPLVGNTSILAKIPYFEHPVTRYLTELGDGIPVAREKDVSPEWQQMAGFSVGRVALRMIETTVKRMHKGINMSGFPEGARNTTSDWQKLMKLEAGFAKIACKAWRENIETSVLPIGIAYKSETKRDARCPVVYFGEPNTGPFVKPNEVRDEMQVSLQEAVNRAYEHHQ